MRRSNSARRSREIRNPDGSVVFRLDDIEVPAQSGARSRPTSSPRNISARRACPARLKNVEENDVPSFLWRSVPDEARSPTCPRPSATAPRRDARQVFDRLAGTWTYWGWKGGYFDVRGRRRTPSSTSSRYMLATQKAAPNSPQWFNTGLHWAYGIDGPARATTTSTTSPAS